MGSFCCWLVDEDMYLRTSISGEIIDLCRMVNTNRVYSVVQEDMVKGCVEL